MKKKWIPGAEFSPILSKLWKIMRLSVFFLLLTIAQVWATTTYSQQTRLSFNLKGAKVIDVLNEIENKSEFFFLFNQKLVDVERKVDIDVEQEKIEEILSQLFAETNVSYLVMDRQIVLTTAKTETNSEQPAKSSISGKVTDVSGLPLPGVSIVIKGTTNGTVSNADGNYSLANIPADATLVFSFVGMKTKEIAATGKSLINISMEEMTLGVEEVVVTALGIEKNKRTLSYATQQVGMESVTTVKDISLGNALAGKLAGVSVSTGSGAGGVGSGSRIIIRGERSIDGNNTPLIIVDGVPSNVGLDAINPDDVESINVLKGASASALYGANAANGVIIVTTKKGKAGETKVEVNSSTSFDVPYLYAEFQNVYGQGNGGVYNQNDEYYSWGPKMEGQTITDWTGKETTLNPQPDNIKNFFRAGYNLTNSLSYSTGNQKSTAYFLYSNITAGGVIPVNKMQRHNFNLRLDTELIKNLKLDFVITWIRGKSENWPVTGDDLFSPMWQLVKMPRSIRTADIQAASYYDENVSLKQLTWAPGSTSVINPYWSAYGREAYSNGSNINMITSLKYNFTPWMYLQVRAQMANNYSDSEEKLYWDTQYVNYGKGKYSRSYSKSLNLNGDVLLGVDKNLSKDFHLSANLGAEIRDYKGASLSSYTGELVLENKFYLDNGKTIATNDGESQTQTQSIYGTAQVGFRNYLFLDVTARNDWDSTLPSPYNYFYPSAGLTSVLSDIISLPEIITYAKIRGSYAEVGNGAKFANIYQSFFRSLNGSVGMFSPSNRKVPTNLIPERTKSWEAGAEIRMLNDRAGIDLTWYKSNTYNQLVYVTSAPSSGYSKAGINCGNIQNKGIEIMVNAIPIQTNDIKWSFNLNFSRNWNKVLELTETLNRYDIPSPNLSIGETWIIVDRPYGEILSKGFVRNDAGQVIVDNLGMPKITAESQTYLGNFNYFWRSGLNSNFKYKNWNLYFLVDLNYGGVRQSATEAQMMLSGTSKASLYGRDGFVYQGVREITNDAGEVVSYVPNDIEITAEMYGKSIGGRATNGCGEAFNHKATNSRLRELSIGYSLPVKNSPLKNITVSAVGRNLFYIYNACKWFDPDVSYDLSTNGQGAESAFLPGCRNIGFNIKLTF